MRFFTSFFALVLGCWQVALCQDVFLKGRYVHIGVHSAGSFGSAGNAPSGYVTRNYKNLGFVCDVGKDGFTNGSPTFLGDYFVPGSPEEGWGIQWNTDKSGSTQRNFNNFGLMGLAEVSRTSHTKVTLPGSQRAEWLGTATSGNQKALVQQIVILDSLDQHFTMQILIKNVGTDTLFGLKYFRNVDPDHEVEITSDYSTVNYVENQPGVGANKDVATVVALGKTYKYPCILGAVDSRARVSVGGFSVRSPDAVLNYTGNYTKANPYDGDVAISLAFNLGKLAPGKCVTFVYFYSLQTVIPKSIAYNLQFQNTISDNKFKTSQKFNSGTYCFYDTTIQIKSDKKGGAIDFVDQVLWDTDNNGSFDKVGDSIEINFAGFKKHILKQRILFCDGSTIDSVYTLTLQPKPTAQFQATTANRCFNDHQIKFSNSSNYFRDSVTKWNWFINDSLFSTSKNPSAHKISSYKTSYLFKLKCYTAVGCMDSALNPMVLLPSPIVKSGMVDTVKCKTKNQFICKNTCSISKGKIIELLYWGDGSMDTASVRKFHSYKNHGRYMVKTKVVSDSGCITNDSVLIHVYPQATLAIKFSDTVRCFKGNNFNAIRQASLAYGTLNYSWRSNATTSTTVDTAFKFSSKLWGQYWVELATKSNYGCTDTIRKNVFVAPQPIISVTYSDTQPCLKGNQWMLTDNSKVPTGRLSRQWQFDNQTDTSISKKIVVTTSGKHPLLLRVITNFGCVDTFRKVYWVHPQVNTGFTVNQDSQCLYKNEFKTLNNSVAMGDTFTCKWVWGNNEWQENTYNSLAKFPSWGERKVQLQTTTIYGCKDTLEKFIKVKPNPVPQFNASFSENCLKGNLYKTTNLSSISEGSMLFFWRISDNTQFLANSISKQFTKPGSYQVKLYANSDFNCLDSVVKTVVIHPQTKLTVGVVRDSQCLRGNKYQYFNNSSIPTGTVTYAWNLDESNLSNLKTPAVVTYNAYGVKNIQVISTSDKLCLDTAKFSVKVNDQPKASIQFNQIDSCEKYNRLELLSNSSIKEGSINHDWLIENQNYANSNLWVYRFKTIGQKLVNLKVTSTFGCMDSTKIWVNIHPTSKVSFNLDTVVCFKGNGLNTNNQSTIAKGSAVYLWQDGVGNSINATNLVNYKYPAIGKYPVSLLAVSDKNCRDTLIRYTRIVRNSYIDISSSKSVSCFKYNKFTIVPVTSNPKVSALTNNWDWGDGSTTTGYQSSHSYAAPGNFNIKLITFNQEGCYDTLFKAIQVLEKINMGASSDSVCFPLSNVLQSSSYCNSDPIVNHLWDIGGYKASGQNTALKLPWAGYYSGALFVETQSGCRDTLRINQFLKVKSKPIADFSLDTFIASQVDLTIQLKNKSTSEVSTWDYQLSNMQNSTDKNPVFTFQDTGYKTVWLRVESSEGCSDTIVKTIGPFYPKYFQYVPNVFTPNGDGTNDCFAPTLSPYIQRFELNVFNPWGQQVYRSSDYHGCWDGFYNGSEALSGAYTYTLYVIDLNGVKRMDRGIFLLLR